MGLVLVGCQMPVCVLIAGLMANRCLLSCYVIYRENKPLLSAVSHSYYSLQPHLFYGETMLLWLANYFQSNSITLLSCQASMRKTPNSSIRCDVGLFVSVIFICDPYPIQHDSRWPNRVHSQSWLGMRNVMMSTAKNIPEKFKHFPICQFRKPLITLSLQTAHSVWWHGLSSRWMEYKSHNYVIFNLQLWQYSILCKAPYASASLVTFYREY